MKNLWIVLALASSVLLGIACGAGTCDPASDDGTKGRCVGTQHQVCDDDGTWIDHVDCAPLVEGNIGQCEVKADTDWPCDNV